MQMTLEKGAAFFSSADHQSFIFGNDLGNPLLYSPDGMVYFELHVSGVSGSMDAAKIAFVSPHTDEAGVVIRTGDKLEVGGNVFSRVFNDLRTVRVIPLPTLRKPEYLFAMPSGHYLYVSADRYIYSYESFKLFIGPMRMMLEVPIINVSRLRDGGTTVITTDKGKLYSPAVLKRDIVPTWQDDIVLSGLDPRESKIVECDGFASIIDRVKIIKK